MKRVLLLLAACGSGVSHDPATDDMVAVPAGGFEMGCHMATDPSCEPDELPYHVVTLAAFHIDRTEVTEAAYGTDPSSHKPATSVSWFEADAYCRSIGKRLPTEAEWEKAARGTDDRVYPWGNDAPTCELANFKDCGEMVEDVGMHPAGASPYGALDMAGNVEEWVADWYGAYPSVALTNPTGPATGIQRVLRGGSFISSAAEIRTSYRNANAPDASATDLDPQTNSVTFGVRCARTQ